MHQSIIVMGALYVLVLWVSEYHQLNDIGLGLALHTQTEQQHTYEQQYVRTYPSEYDDGKLTRQCWCTKWIGTGPNLRRMPTYVC